VSRAAESLGRFHPAIAERDGGWSCHYCGIPLVHYEGLDFVGALACDGGGWIPAPGYAFPVADHVVPRSAGGADAIENLVLACASCNNYKGTGSYADFVKVAQ
jgi:hypothetical protein